MDVCPGFDDLADLDLDFTPDACDSDRDGDTFDESVDCNENDPSVGAAFTVYWDMDGDTYGGTAFFPNVVPVPSASLQSLRANSSDASTSRG